MSYELIRIIESMLTPPGLMFCMIFVGFLLGNYFTRLARSLIYSGLLLLFIASLPAINKLAHYYLESFSPISQAQLEQSQAEAIVILGGGRYPGYEYRKETVSLATLERLRYGAWLHKLTNLPILVTGGSVRGEAVSEARLMAQTLSASFNVKTKWIEEKSRNTWENALFSRHLLDKSKISQILLVTHASHMWRSQAVFTRQGFITTPAPLGFSSRKPLEILDFIPNAGAMSGLKSASHELLGRIWYMLRY